MPLFFRSFFSHPFHMRFFSTLYQYSSTSSHLGGSFLLPAILPNSFLPPCPQNFILFSFCCIEQFWSFQLLPLSPSSAVIAYPKPVKMLVKIQGPSETTSLKPVVSIGVHENHLQILLKLNSDAGSSVWDRLSNTYLNSHDLILIFSSFSEKV